MRSGLSMQNLLAALIISAAAGLSAGVGVTSIRQAGEPLDPSIQNEVGHAVSLAAEWLAARQNADGSWGSETDRVERTSVALLALTSRAHRHSDARARAAVWLDSHPPAANGVSEAHAWRIIALLSVAPDTPARTNLVRRLLQEAQPHAPGASASFCGQLLWSDALALAERQPPASDTETALKDCARNWPPAASSQPDCLWLPTHLINRRAEGALSRDGEPLDWRRDVAQILVNAQRRDPSGGGFWGDDAGDSRIRQTAFALLTLGEL